MFNSNTSHSCRRSDFPGGERSGHSLCGHFLCGGGTSTDSDTQRTCLKLNPLTGDFTFTPVTLIHKRSGHMCWDIDGEDGPVLLLGGVGKWVNDGSHGPEASRTTELVSSDGSSSSASFSLLNDTM